MMMRASPAAVPRARRSLWSLPASVRAQEVAPAHGMAMHGDLKYGPDFEHFDYVNPNAPKGGTRHLRRDRHASTRSIPSSSKARRADGLGFLFETLTTQSQDEPFSEYGLLAEIDRDAGGPLLGRLHAAPGSALARRQADDRRRRDLELQDAQGKGRAILSRLLQERDQGRAGGRAPRQVHLRGDDQSRAAADPRPAADPAQALLRERRVRQDDVAAAARQRPLSHQVARAGPAHRATSGSRTTGAPTCRSTAAPTTSTRSATSTTATPTSRSRRSRPAPTTSASRTPPSSGRPPIPARCSMPAGSSRRRSRTSSAPACRASRSISAGRCSRIRRVRQALAYAFDFEWTNRTIMYGQYDRTESYFSNTELAADGPAERGRARAARAVSRPAAGGGVHRGLPGARRPRARAASGRTCAPRCGCCARPAGASRTAGWSMAQGQPFRFEILLNGPSFERHTLPFIKNLERLGIAGHGARGRPGAVPEPAGRVRFRHGRGELRPEPVARATSSGTSGAAKPPTSPAAATSSASRIRWSIT